MAIVVGGSSGHGSEGPQIAEVAPPPPYVASVIRAQGFGGKAP